MDPGRIKRAGLPARHSHESRSRHAGGKGGIVAIAASQGYLTLASVRYQTGFDSYVAMLTAQITLLANHRTALNLVLEQLTAGIQLIKALGGGWEVSPGATAAIP
jgi:outer membrane protein TolC